MIAANRIGNELGNTTRKVTRKSSVKVRRTPRGTRMGRRAAMVLGILAAGLLAVSMSHLADGFAVFTHSPLWMAWAMAIVMDAAQLACEGAMVAVGDAADRTTKKLLHGVAVTCTLVSIGMNVAAFTANATSSLTLVFCGFLGVAIPLLVLALGQAATRLATR